jgi:peptidoglycan/LPS O-acetylase OafA/YrhL
VVFDHLTYSVFQPVRDSVYHWFDPGQYGVFVFFLVSGYIVPASLERRGSVRGFWVSRVSGVLVPGSLSYDLLTPGVVVAITDSLILAGLVLTLAGRGRTRIAGAVLAALTGLLLIVFNSGFAAPWETFTIFALMFTGTMLYRAEAGQYPWRRALYVSVLVFGLTLVAVQWHVSPLAENDLAIRKTFNTLELAGLTFAVAMLCRHKTVPRALAWLGLVSYSVYLLHPVLIEVYDSVPWARNQNFVPTELLLVAVFLLVLLVCCGLTHRLIEAPMQRLGRRVTRRLDVRFGPDTVASQPDGTQ